MNARTPSSMSMMFLITMLFATGRVFPQQVEYRITDDRRYQYLSDRQETGMIFDESLGTYYKDITVRTFYLETQRRGFIPGYLSFNVFTNMTLSQQRAMLTQPSSEVDCSSNNISSACLDYIERQPDIPKAEGAQVVDLSPKCIDNGQGKGQMSLTTKLLVNPNDASLENTDCDEQYEASPADNSKQQQMKNVKLILGKD